MVRNLLSQCPERMERPKVLLLGISYPDVYGQMDKHGFDQDVLIETQPSIEQAVECVRRGILTEMDARDLARCVATENECKVDVYTASKEIGAVYRSDRHIYGDFNSRNFVRNVRQAFGETVQFSQIILDYYWMPTGWLVTRWAKTLFQRTLPNLVKYNLLTYPSTRASGRRTTNNSSNSESAIYGGNNNNNNNTNNTNGQRNSAYYEEGVVLLPFCAHVCKELVGAIDILQHYYAISFVNKKELQGHSLWKGTMSIDADTMQSRLGKRLDQEEVYCTFRPKDIYESMEDSHVSKPEVMRILMAIEDYDNIRMIRLRPLRQHEPPSVMKERLVKPEKGGFKGLNFRLAREQKLLKQKASSSLSSSSTTSSSPVSSSATTPSSPTPSTSTAASKKKKKRQLKFELAPKTTTKSKSNKKNSNKSSTSSSSNKKRPAPFTKKKSSSSNNKKKKPPPNTSAPPPKKKLKVVNDKQRKDDNASIVSESTCNPDDEHDNELSALTEDLPDITYFFPGPAVDLTTYSDPDLCEQSDGPNEDTSIQRRTTRATKRSLEAAAKSSFQALDHIRKKGPEYLTFNPRRRPPGKQRTLLFNHDPTTATQRRPQINQQQGIYVTDLNVPGVNPYRDYTTEDACRLFDIRQASSLKGVSRNIMKTKHLTCYKIPKKAICDALKSPRTRPEAVTDPIQYLLDRDYFDYTTTTTTTTTTQQQQQRQQDYDILVDMPIFQWAVQACRGQWDSVLDDETLKAMEEHKVVLKERMRKARKGFIDRRILLDTVVRWLAFEREPSLDPTGALSSIYQQLRESGVLKDKYDFAKQAKLIEARWHSQSLNAKKKPKKAIIAAAAVASAKVPKGKKTKNTTTATTTTTTPPVDDSTTIVADETTNNNNDDGLDPNPVLTQNVLDWLKKKQPVQEDLNDMTTLIQLAEAAEAAAAQLEAAEVVEAEAAAETVEAAETGAVETKTVEAEVASTAKSQKAESAPSDKSPVSTTPPKTTAAAAAVATTNVLAITPLQKDNSIDDNDDKFFFKIDSMLPREEGQSLEDRAKELAFSFETMRNLNTLAMTKTTTTSADADTQASTQEDSKPSAKDLSTNAQTANDKSKESETLTSETDKPSDADATSVDPAADPLTLLADSILDHDNKMVSTTLDDTKSQDCMQQEESSCTNKHQNAAEKVTKEEVTKEKVTKEKVIGDKVEPPKKMILPPGGNSLDSLAVAASSNKKKSRPSKPKVSKQVPSKDATKSVSPATKKSRRYAKELSASVGTQPPSYLGVLALAVDGPSKKLPPKDDSTNRNATAATASGSEKAATATSASTMGKTSKMEIKESLHRTGGPLSAPPPLQKQAPRTEEKAKSYKGRSLGEMFGVSPKISMESQELGLPEMKSNSKKKKVKKLAPPSAKKPTTKSTKIQAAKPASLKDKAKHSFRATTKTTPLPAKKRIPTSPLAMATTTPQSDNRKKPPVRRPGRSIMETMPVLATMTPIRPPVPPPAPSPPHVDISNPSPAVSGVLRLTGWTLNGYEAFLGHYGDWYSPERAQKLGDIFCCLTSQSAKTTAMVSRLVQFLHLDGELQDQAIEIEITDYELQCIMGEFWHTSVHDHLLREQLLCIRDIVRQEVAKFWSGFEAFTQTLAAAATTTTTTTTASPLSVCVSPSPPNTHYHHHHHRGNTTTNATANTILADINVDRLRHWITESLLNSTAGTTTTGRTTATTATTTAAAAAAVAAALASSNHVSGADYHRNGCFK